MASPSRRFPIGLTVAAALATALLIGLGVWQLQRLQWKTALLARVAALQAAPAQPVAAVLARAARGEDVDLTRVVADCPGLASAAYVSLYSVRDGGAGVRLISPCVVDGAPYRSILVDRGFVADTVSARPAVDRGLTAPVRVVGVLRKPDKPTFVTPANRPIDNQWYSRDIAAMAATLRAAAPAPLFLMAETPTNPDWKALQPAPLPVEIPNRHLEYALTWFGLAGALACVYAAVLWRRWKD